MSKEWSDKFRQAVSTIGHPCIEGHWHTYQECQVREPEPAPPDAFDQNVETEGPCGHRC